MSYIIPTRPSAAEREMIRAAARKRGMSVSRFMVEAACKLARDEKRTFASLEIDSDYRMPPEASENPNSFIRARVKAKHAIHR
jgi:uncharacterized protein (DUF1778 family)